MSPNCYTARLAQTLNVKCLELTLSLAEMTRWELPGGGSGRRDGAPPDITSQRFYPSTLAHFLNTNSYLPN